jgi:hypothetical protein
MNAALVDSIVKAVLYEGYMLYPYRPSAIKNRQRFNFGVLYPQAYSGVLAQSDASGMQTQCLVEGDPATLCTVKVQFLRIVERSGVQGTQSQPWQEAVEEVVEITDSDLMARDGVTMQFPFRLSAKVEREVSPSANAALGGELVRKSAEISGKVELSSERLAPSLFRLTVKITNETQLDPELASDREAALSRALVSTHTILQVTGGQFVSLIDPPDVHRDAALDCKNIGTWPVLVGENGERDTLLSSPIILYDYPQIAPESAGDLFDGAEIDEILSLRILTLTDDEKREICNSDDRARQILQRTEAMPQEQWMKLHGALRGLRAAGGEQP